MITSVYKNSERISRCQECTKKYYYCSTVKCDFNSKQIDFKKLNGGGWENNA